MKPLIALICLASTSLAASAKPNVLFLFADDMRADSIAALGNPVVKTPTLDSLVNRGFSFSNAFCLGGNSAAVCTPSRNMLLSGKAYFRWQNLPGPNGKKLGALAPGDAPNFPLSMKDAGYVTYHEGKKGNTAVNIQAKFDHNVYINENADRNSGEPGKVIADDVIEFLKTKKDEKPFFMYLAFGNPHDPRVAAQKYLDMYDRSKIPLPPDYMPQHPFDNGEMTIRDEQLSPWPRTEDEIRKHLHEYYAVITALDLHIGRIIATLKELGQLDNTIILFSADQGIAIGSHGLLGKQNLYNSGMKVPLVFAGPGITKGSSDAMVYLLDIYPTVCHYVGATIPTDIDGVSFKPVIDGSMKSTREELFLSYQLVQRAVIADGWKLIRYPQINRSQLFDFKNDPYELKDVAADPAQAERLASLTAKLEKWQKRYGDDLPLTSATPKPAEWTPPAPGSLQKAVKGQRKKPKQ
ncbi:MAG: sulfatase-like hydrolase/transferase [Verrucomicrobiaceae bacterium]|nr:sulfatase-like hydrolase/transferase [Verrucomicrobiaceae bacterium]